MKAKVEVIIERKETATQELARGIEEATDTTGNRHDEIKERVEMILETEYDTAEVRFVEEV